MVDSRFLSVCLLFSERTKSVEMAASWMSSIKKDAKFLKPITMPARCLPSAVCCGFQPWELRQSQRRREANLASQVPSGSPLRGLAQRANHGRVRGSSGAPLKREPCFVSNRSCLLVQPHQPHWLCCHPQTWVADPMLPSHHLFCAPRGAIETSRMQGAQGAHSTRRAHTCVGDSRSSNRRR